MLSQLKEKLQTGSLRVGGFLVRWKVTRGGLSKRAQRRRLQQARRPYKLHLGPGGNWDKPDAHWLAVDIDPDRGDLVVDFGDFDGFPLGDESVAAIYGAHVFEHMSIFTSQVVFDECWRVLQPGGFLRLVLPDVERSIRAYIEGEADFRLFERRRERAAARWKIPDYTLFDCLREDFLSRSAQPALLGAQALAHQNAWDFDALRADLERAGFAADAVQRMDFQETNCEDFRFEGTYPSEANADYRSLYVEAEKR